MSADLRFNKESKPLLCAIVIKRTGRTGWNYVRHCVPCDEGVAM